MSNEFLGDRRAALEEAFFAKHNAQLRRRLQEADQARQNKEALAAASGITDDAVLDRLLDLNIGSDTLAALSLVPLVAVAWADGSIEEKERNVAFSKAAEMDLGNNDISYQLFSQWLSEPPPPALMAAWKDYIAALSAALSPEARPAFKQEILNHARAVAEAAGGVLGLVRKVSPAEERVLKELGQAFSE
jgi:hypothetical protein